MVVVDTSILSADSFTCAFAILAVGLLLLISSLISICILLNNKNETDVISYYLISLAFADLLCSVIIVPLSVYSSIHPNWNFMGDNSLLCRSAAYVHVVLVSSTAYTCAWVGVDRYSAFMKPSRYEIEHTLTRCKCWIAFSWVTAVFLACPIIVAKMEVNYYHELEMCVLNWSATMAYSITLGVLVFLPTLCTVVFTCGSVLIALNKNEELEDSQRTAYEMDDNFVATFFILIVLLLVWAPIVVIIFIPTYLIPSADSAKMKFLFMWLAIGGSSVKLLIYTIANREYRNSLLSLLCCFYPFGRRRKQEQQLIADNNNERVIGGLFEAAALGAQTAAKMGNTVNHEENLLLVGNSGSHAVNHVVMNPNSFSNAVIANNAVYNSSPYHNQQQRQPRTYFHPQQRLLPRHEERAEMNSLSPSCRVTSKSTINSPITANLNSHMPEYGSFSRNPVPISY